MKAKVRLYTLALGNRNTGLINSFISEKRDSKSLFSFTLHFCCGLMVSLEVIQNPDRRACRRAPGHIFGTRRISSSNELRTRSSPSIVDGAQRRRTSTTWTIATVRHVCQFSVLPLREFHPPIQYHGDWRVLELERANPDNEESPAIGADVVAHGVEHAIKLEEFSRHAC